MSSRIASGMLAIGVAKPESITAGTVKATCPGWLGWRRGAKIPGNTSLLEMSRRRPVTSRSRASLLAGRQQPHDPNAIDHPSPQDFHFPAVGCAAG
jgi:hypothetical protein